MPIAKAKRFGNIIRSLGLRRKMSHPAISPIIWKCRISSVTMSFDGNACNRFVPVGNQATFRAIDGITVCDRNYIGVLTSVNCSATVAISQSVNRDPQRLSNVNGVVAAVHGTGCGMADSGEGYENLQRRGATSISAAFYWLVRCPVNQIDFLLKAYGIERGPKFTQ